MNSEMFKLKLMDVARGAITAVLAALFVTLAGVFNTAGFDVFSANWGEILGSALNASLAAGGAYLTKNFFTDSEGKMFGKIG